MNTVLVLLYFNLTCLEIHQSMCSPKETLYFAIPDQMDQPAGATLAVLLLC